MQGERSVEYLLSSFAGAPLVAGDLRKLNVDLRQRLTRLTQAFNSAAAQGPMTEFQVLENEQDFDSFLRIGADGHGIACAFNRTNHVRTFSSPDKFRFINAETGKEELSVPPHDCMMFLVFRSTFQK